MPLPPGQEERRAGRVDEAMANTERLTNLIKIVGIALAIYVAIAVTVASIFGVTNSVRSVDHAAKAEKFALQALNQARVNAVIGKNVQELVAAQGACEEGDPPTSPACVRQARTNKIVGDAIASIRSSIEMHDLNDRAAHELLAQVRRSTSTLPPRASITTPPRTTTTIQRVTTTTTRPPTTCPKRGNSDKCR